MRLRDLEAVLLWELTPTGDFRRDNPACPSLAEAQGIMFLCPKCFVENNGPIGTHSVICWFNGRGVPADMFPGPGRWNPMGNGIDDVTFVGPGAYSVQLIGGCNWHGFVTNGDAT